MTVIRKIKPNGSQKWVTHIRSWFTFLFHSDFILPFLEKLRWSRKAMSLSILKRLSSFRSGNNDLGEISVYYKSLLRQKETRNLSSTPHRIDRLDETVKYIDFYKSLTCTRHTFLKDIPVILQYKTLNNNCFRTIPFFFKARTPAINIDSILENHWPRLNSIKIFSKDLWRSYQGWRGQLKLIERCIV